MRILSGRRPEFMFLIALLVLGSTLVARTMLSRPQASLAIDTSAPPNAPVALDSEKAIAQFQEKIRANPDDTSAYAQLGLAYLQRVRENADPSLYGRAEQAFNEALKRDPNQLDALIGQGSLALSRHQFTDAERWGERARAINPYRSAVYGIIGDAQTELGRYDEAVATFQKMINTRPDLSSYSRVSYARELHGDTAGAIDAMQKALTAGGGAMENTLWTQVQLGNLFFNSGNIQRAEEIYLAALKTRPDYVYAFAGIGKVRAAQGRIADAIEIDKKAAETLPLPEFVIALGELYEMNGQPTQAKQQYDLVEAMQKLNQSAGIDVDMELALFDADHGLDPAQAVTRARASYARRPSIYGADALAWALYKHGDFAEAHKYSQEALHLNTRDANLRFRAGMIAQAAGDTTTARNELKLALDINPHFSILHAPEAKQMLQKLGA